MEFVFDAVNTFSHVILGKALPFLIALTVVVFFHELGHFLVARRCGVAVESFSIGFGSEIFGWTDKHKTRWKVCWIPLGGYVKFLGDEEVTSTRPSEDVSRFDADQRAHSFHHKPLAQRAAIVAAGPIANFILAIVIYALVFSIFGEPLGPARVDKVTSGSPAEKVGFKPGDVILTVDGEKIDSSAELTRITSEAAGRQLTVEFRREGQIIALRATPQLEEVPDIFGGKHRRGLLGLQVSQAPEESVWVRHDPISAIAKGVDQTYFIATRTLTGVWEIIIGVQPADSIRGPLGIGDIAGKVASISIIAFIQLIAILSVSIGLINLFPVPMLDGGHLLYYGIEAVRGRPLSERSQEYGFRAGLAMIVMLMVFATSNDLGRWGLFDSLRDFFS
jgi:regulator of sigma E protease